MPPTDQKAPTVGLGPNESPTHPDPSIEDAAPILSCTEGDRISIGYRSGHPIMGRVRATAQQEAGQYFDLPSCYRMRLEAADVTFRLTVWFREPEGGVTPIEALDLRLVEGRDWSIPLAIEITDIRSG